MSNYEDHVYLAKLAEQAERYEGKVTQDLLVVLISDLTCRDG